MLAVIETHPVQYHAPVYRSVEQDFGVPVTAIYGSDFSVAGYTDSEFKSSFAWDVDLLGGYSSRFLHRSIGGVASDVKTVQARRLRETLAEVAPKAVMLVGYSPRFHRVAFREARRSRRPIIFRGETTDHAEHRNRLKTWVRDGALRFLYSRCERLLYVGEHSHEHFRRLGCAPDKLIFSPYCVDVAHFQPGEEDRISVRDGTREELGISRDRKVLIFSGKLSKRKGVDLLLAAVKLLPSTLRDTITILFLGDGELRAVLELQAKETPAVATNFVGFQNQTQLSRFYHAADLLILPSVRSETWGLVVNEALHHGLPCVVSEAVGCAPDLIVRQATGEICESKSITQLAEAITRACVLICRSDIRRQCRDRLLNYSVSRAASGIAQAYNEVVLKC
jgi:glycosyltransferase involved in cell wall biosynthesis